MGPELEFAHKFVEVAKQLSGDGMSTGLQQAVNLAAETIPGCDYAGITLIQPGRVFTPAATQGPAAEIDQLQCDINDGPCLYAARQDVPWIQIDSLETDGRWPRFAARARELGVASVLSCDVDSPRGMVGALNLYSGEQGAFDESSREIAFIYAAHAGVALSAQRLQDSLRAAMDSRESIGVAIGVLMERHKVTRSQAFDMLVKVSQDTNIKVREVAERVTITGQEPNQH